MGKRKKYKKENPSSRESSNDSYSSRGSDPDYDPNEESKKRGRGNGGSGFSQRYESWVAPLDDNPQENARLLLRVIERGGEITTEERNNLSPDRRRALASIHATAVIAEENRFPGAAGKAYRQVLRNIADGRTTFSKGFSGYDPMQILAGNGGTGNFREFTGNSDNETIKKHFDGDISPSSGDEETKEMEYEKNANRLARTYARGLARRKDSHPRYISPLSEDEGIRSIIENGRGSSLYRTPFGNVTVTYNQNPTLEVPFQLQISTNRRNHYPRSNGNYWNGNTSWQASGHAANRAPSGNEVNVDNEHQPEPIVSTENSIISNLSTEDLRVINDIMDIDILHSRVRRCSTDEYKEALIEEEKSYSAPSNQKGRMR